MPAERSGNAGIRESAATAPPASGAVAAPLLQARGVAKRFGGVQALASGNLEIRSGEVLGLVGENGAGKSTLIEILAGAIQLDAGTIRIEGEVVEIGDERAAEALGIHVLHQNLALVDRISVAENLLLGKRLERRGGVVSAARNQRVARTMLEGFVKIDPTLPVSRLSVVERWMVAIAKACAGDPRLVIMDEPTAALSETEVRTVSEAIARLRERGIAVLFVSHRLDEIMSLCDRVAVMKDGRSLGIHLTAELDRDRLVELIVGGDKAESLAVLEHEAPPEPGPVVLSVRGLCGGPLRDVSLDLHEGEILGIGGLVGAGRSSLLTNLFGAHRPEAGQVELIGPKGTPLPLRTPNHAIKQGVALIPEERRTQALMLMRGIRENTVLSNLRRFRRGRFVPVPSRRGEARATEASVESLGVRSAGIEQPVLRLSGGNQQKVVFARALMADDLRVLLLDEPTKGVDVGARFELYGIIREIAARGVAVMLVSSELEEFAAICHRAIVLREGCISGELRTPMTESEILGLCF